MNKRMITYAVLVAMVLSVFCFPATGYANTVNKGVTEAAGTIEAGAVASPADVKEEIKKDTAAKAKSVTISAPKKISAKALSSTAVRIAWSKVKGADGYSVYRYSPKAKRWITVKENVKGSSFIHTKRQARYVYRYGVKAYKEENGKRYYSKRSSYVKVRTLHNEETKRAAIVRTAKSRVGCAYRSGASGPRAFDCSGLVYWTYKNADVKAKRTVKRTSSAGLYASLKSYKAGSSLKSAEKGDIILFSRGGRIGHAGIYIGDGKMVHAATPRKGVCIASVKSVHNSGTRVKAIIDIL